MSGYELFKQHLRHALNHLYDPEVLRSSPLKILMIGSSEVNSAAALERLLRQAIESIKPASSLASNAPEWQIYELLYYRYVQRAKQADLARQFACSVRQLKRIQSTALTYLAEYLLTQAGLSEHDLEQFVEVEPSLKSDEEAWTLADEYERLRKESGGKKTDVAHETAAVLKILEPLIRQYRILVHDQISDLSLYTSMPDVVLRQVLLTVVSNIIRTFPNGHIFIEATANTNQIWIQIQANSSSSELDDVESLTELFQDASHLLELGKGALSVSDDDDFAVTIQIPKHFTLKILAIDDNRDILQLFERYLTDSRYELVPCHDPEIGLQLVQSENPSVVILDLMMTHHDGWQLLRQLRNEPYSAKLPIIICTVLHQEDLAKSLGATGYLRKPVSREDFLNVLNLQFARLE